MIQSGIVKTMTGGVGRRIFGLLLVSAIVPLMFTAWLAWYEHNRGLEQDVEHSLAGSAKEYGTEIHTRLKTSAEKGQEIIRIATRDGLASIYDHEYLVDDFEAVWVIRENIEPDIPLEADGEGIEISAAEDEFLSAGGTRMVLTPNQNLIMLQAVGDWAPGCVVAFQLNSEKIWQAGPDLPDNTDFCVFGTNGQNLYCTTSVDSGLHSSLIEMDDSRVSAFGEWMHGGEAQYAALWPLLLARPFAAPAFDIVAMQPQSIALQSGADFRRIYIPVVMLVLILVAILGFNLIGRSLVPLQQLTHAAQQIAAGKLSSRVRVGTGDEFERLGDAFNNMAERLENQISAMEAMSGIDQLILTGSKIEEVSKDVVTHLVALTQCEAAAVIARDADAPEIGRMISMHNSAVYHDHIELPPDVSQRWCEPWQVELETANPVITTFADRFISFEQQFVVLVPVVLQKNLKGVLLLGFTERFDMAPSNLLRITDLAGRFAVALSSVEREEALYRQAHFDQLTGLPNRQLLKDRLNDDLSSARIDDHGGAILFLDLDRFKEINDVFGHTIGDGVLTQASQRIMSVVRKCDTVARLGGDEFVVVLSNVRNDGIVRATAERLLGRLSEAFTVSGSDHYLSASIGIAMFPEDGTTVETLLKNADAAMYRAKDAGRNRFEFFSKRLNAESRRKIGVERDLRIAFQNDQLDVHYQPQFDISTGEISGAEALLRWHHPDRGPISPTEFIPLAEDSELVVDIGSWVLRKACENLCALIDKGFHPGSISINVSGRQLADDNFGKSVMGIIRSFGIHPGYIQLEVTETAVAQNRDRAIAILQLIREAGVRVAIDDFGTGYSSLSYLQQMPFDLIKIDKSFIDTIGSNATSDNICLTIIKMAEQLGKKSIAEGVETREQLDFLRNNGCDFVQGFFYSEALPEDEFLAFVEKQDSHTQRRRALEII